MPYQQTIQQVRETLISTFDALDTWFDQPADIRAYKPNDGGWCIDEILEHITLTSHFLMLVISSNTQKAIKRAAVQPIENDEGDLSRIEPVADPDAFAWIRPEHMQPTGTKPSDEVRRLMRDQQRECLEILETLNNGVGSLVTVRMSVQNLGKIDLYQWLYFLALHAQRHHIEIERISQEWNSSKPN